MADNTKIRNLLGKKALSLKLGVSARDRVPKSLGVKLGVSACDSGS